MQTNSRPVALITGAATGVGRATALQFARKGYDLVINYSRSESDALQVAQEIEALGCRTLVFRCDVSDDACVRNMIEAVKNTFGRLDALVNNAATTNFIEHTDLEGMSEAMWDRMLGVNLKGTFFVTRAAAELLKGGDGGSVVNVSSVAAESGRGSSIAYCASKAGINTMTKSLARVLAPKVRVNAVSPGPIDSRWIREGNPNWDLDAMVAKLPIPRASMPDDIADAILFFATGTTMATGQILTIDGGLSL